MGTRTRFVLLSQFIRHCQQSGASLEQIHDALLVAGLPSNQLEPIFEKYIFGSQLPTEISLDIAAVKTAQHQIERSLNAIRRPDRRAFSRPRRKTSRKIELDLKPLRKLRAQQRARKVRASRMEHRMMVRGQSASSGGFGYSVLVILGLLMALVSSHGVISGDDTRIENPDVPATQQTSAPAEAKASKRDSALSLRRRISMAQLPVRRVSSYSGVKSLDNSSSKIVVRNAQKANRKTP
jgi:hypothetical protein